MKVPGAEALVKGSWQYLVKKVGAPDKPLELRSANRCSTHAIPLRSQRAGINKQRRINAD
jgi:hypothetical protein